MKPIFLPNSSFSTDISTINAVIINPNNDIWRYRDTLKNINLDFRRFPVSEELLRAIKYAFIWYVENLSPDSVCNLYVRSLKFFHFAFIEERNEIKKVTLKQIVGFYASLDDKSKYILGCISGLFKRLHSYRLGVVDDDVILYFKNRKIKGNDKGIPVAIWDPEVGPFSDLEYKALSSKLHDAHRNEDISQEDFLLAWLFLAFGSRPLQYAALRVCDFSVTKDNSGEYIFSLKIPRAKQRNSPSRTHFKDRLLISTIGREFIAHTVAVQANFSKRIDDPRQAPLFPAINKALSAPPGYEWHPTASNICTRCRKIFDTLEVKSERTGSLIHINPLRFRYSVGTRAAMEGHGEYVIAELLDHSDTQNVGVYVKAVPQLSEHFTPQFAKELAPIVKAFKGKVISSTGCTDPSQNIYAIEYNSSIQPTGSCGKHRKCQLFEPLMCYTCRSFRPWQTGPHAAVLHRLIDDRDRLLASPHPDLQMATVNDHTILAVAEVVRQCEKLTSVQEEV